MHVNFKAKQPQQRKRAINVLTRTPPVINAANVLVEHLNTHLHFGCTKRTHKTKIIGCYGVGPRFDNKTNHTMVRTFVYALLMRNIIKRCHLMQGKLPPLRACCIACIKRVVIRGISLIDSLLQAGVLRYTHLGIKHKPALLIYPRARTPRIGTCIAAVKRPKYFAHKPHLICLGVVAPRAAQNNDFNFIGRVPHIHKRLQAQTCLQKWVE